MNAFTIKDLENLSGIKAHTIRIWEQRYSFLRPQRTTTNIRYYTTDELKKLLGVALLNKYGYKVSQIDRMSNTEMNDKILSLTQPEAQNERIVNDLLRNMISLDVEAFEFLLDSQILARGIEKCIMHIMFPFLEKIGVLWITNRIVPAHEHLVSNVIRQKMIVGIENARSHTQLDKTILMFLPEGEHHETGLLFAHFLLKSLGNKILYMGADTPMNDLAFLVNQKMPDIIYSHIISVPNNFNFDKFLQGVGSASKGIPVLLSGKIKGHHKGNIDHNIIFKHSLQEVMEYISAV